MEPIGRPRAGHQVTAVIGTGVVAPGALVASADDLGLTRGDGVFDAMRVLPRGDGWEAENLERHLRRFVRSAAAAELPEPDLGQWRAAIAQAMAACDLESERHVVAHACQDDLRVRVLHHESRQTTVGRRVPAGEGDHAGLLALVRAAEHAREGMDQSGLAGPGGPEQQHPLTRFDRERHVADRPALPAGVAPSPPRQADVRSGHRTTPSRQTSSLRARPDSNRDRAPVPARARVRAQPTTPARTAPEIASAPR